MDHGLLFIPLARVVMTCIAGWGEDVVMVWYRVFEGGIGFGMIVGIVKILTLCGGPGRGE